MKRIMALALFLLMLSMAAAQAAEWGEGKSPDNPYSGLPAMELSETVGYMMPYPNAAMSAQNSCQYLMLYLPREDMQAGEGTLWLYDGQGNEIWQTAMNNAEAVTRREITEAEKDGLLWGGGSCFEIRLPKTLTLNTTYFVNLGEGCLVSEDGALKSPIVGGDDLWRFEVTGDYGVSDMAYLRGEEPVLTPQAGDTIRCTIEIGGDAATAVLYGYNGTVDFLETAHRQTVEVNGKVTGESPVWGVMVLDADGNELGLVEFN